MNFPHAFRFVVAALLFVSVAWAGCLDLREGGEQKTAPQGASPTTTTTATQTVTQTATVTPSPGPTGSNTATPVPSSSPSPSPSSSPGPTPPPAAEYLRVEFQSYPDAINASDTVNVTWHVIPEPSRNVTIDHTELHFGNASVAFPSSNESDYPETAGRRENVTTPGTFFAEFTASSNETLFLRAHAVLNGSYYWSTEISIRANITRVAIQAGLHLSSYEPDPVTIQLGEGIKWTNEDSLTHTATNDPGTPQNFTTGDIRSDETSAIVYFAVAGTYAYHCQYHPSTMQGTIEVLP